MAIKTEIVNELKEISPFIAGLERVNPYTVPAGYFEELSLPFLSNAAESSSLLQSLSTKNPMRVPEGYFDTLADTLLAKIKLQESQSVDEELRSLSPMLYAADKVNVYQVPAGYFESVSDDILHKVSSKETAKVISFTQHKTIRWMRYAVAAAVIGVAGMFSFYLLNNDSSKKLDKVVRLGISYAKANKFDEVLSKTSDEAIASYLDKTADEADALQMVANIDQGQLPSEADLISDEKLIDDLIKESENKTTN